MTPTLETSRLLLRPLELADAKQVQPLFSQWEILRYLTNIVPWPYPPDGSHRYYRDVALPAIERGDEWHWTLRLKESPAAIIGGITLRKGETDNRGFWMALPWQGRGLMSEACEVVTDFWFSVLKFPGVAAPRRRLRECGVSAYIRESRQRENRRDKKNANTFRAASLQKYGK